MTQSEFVDWVTQDYGDRRLRRRLEGEIDDAEQAAYSSQATLRSQLAQVQGTLEERLNRLATAFDAFVELSDVRAELAVFEEETTVRHAAQRLLRGLLGRGSDPSAPLAGLPADMPACPGYWLRPALVWLSAALSESQPDQAGVLAEAQRLDPVRTAMFLAAGLGLAGQVPRAYPLLESALRQPGEQVTYAQRALWLACAHGVFGDAGQQLIQDWLARYVRGLDSSAAEAAITQWNTDCEYTFGAGALRVQFGQGLSFGLSENDAVIAPLVAGQKLSKLNTLIHEAMTDESQTPPAALAEPDPGPDPVVAALAAVVAALVEEGSNEEVTLRQRERQLREVIDSGKAGTRPSWDATEDATLTLLRKDAFGGDLYLRRVAVTSCADWVTRIAVQFAEAAAAPPPEQVAVVVRGRDIQVSASGEPSLQAAKAEIEQSYQPESTSARLFQKKQLAEAIASEEDRLAEEAKRAAAAYRDRAAQIRAAAAQAEADRDAITAALAARS
jgi:hypothetical protein